MKIAILDDYQNVSMKLADWSALAQRAEVTVFNDHLADPQALIERLRPYDIVCIMRERTPLPRDVISQLPLLKLIASTGPVNVSVDIAAAKERGIIVTSTGYSAQPTIELTWALILASMRYIVAESNAVRAGGWQSTIGLELEHKILGIVGLGRVGTHVARIGVAFGMKIIAWSQNMTPEIAASAGAVYVSKSELFARSDVVSIHLVLSKRTRGIVGASELGMMKPTARLINTSRGKIIDEAALIAALRSHSIGGAALDVFEEEPLPIEHPFRTLENVLATPHIGYVGEDLYRLFYQDVVTNISSWLSKRDVFGAPVN